LLIWERDRVSKEANQVPDSKQLLQAVLSRTAC
jgi:hypothetical protein